MHSYLPKSTRQNEGQLLLKKVVLSDAMIRYKSLNFIKVYIRVSVISLVLLPLDSECYVPWAHTVASF